MDIKKCYVCGKMENLLLCSACKNVAYCSQEHQKLHWPEHRVNCQPFISGTKVRATTPMAPNPLDESLEYHQRRHGRTMERPLAGIMHFKYNVDGTPRARVVLPGKLTPYQDPTPYLETGSKLVPLPSGKYRHIASFSLEELRQLGWDGARYYSDSLKENWVPFVCGYDSDPGHEYEPFDIEAAKSLGVVGNPMVGLYAQIPTQGLIRINK